MGFDEINQRVRRAVMGFCGIEVMWVVMLGRVRDMRRQC